MKLKKKKLKLIKLKLKLLRDMMLRRYFRRDFLNQQEKQKFIVKKSK